MSDSTAAVDCEIEEVHDDVVIDNNATGNTFEEVYDDVEATETGRSNSDSFTTNTEVYENLESSIVVKNDQCSTVVWTHDEAAVEVKVQTPLSKETESDEFDDDSFTSEIYENVDP